MSGNSVMQRLVVELFDDRHSPISTKLRSRYENMRTWTWLDETRRGQGMDLAWSPTNDDLARENNLEIKAGFKRDQRSRTFDSESWYTLRSQSSRFDGAPGGGAIVLAEDRGSGVLHEIEKTHRDLLSREVYARTRPAGSVVSPLSEGADPARSRRLPAYPGVVRLRAERADGRPG